MLRLKTFRVFARAIILVLLFLQTISFAQPRERSPLHLGPSPVQIEKNILFENGNFICYVSYRIPYNFLVFVKQSENYSAGLTIDFELKDGNGIAERNSLTKNVTVDSYEKTKTEDEYVQGVISFLIKKENEVIFPYLSIANSDRNIRLDSLVINTKKFIDEKFTPPIIVQKPSNGCSSSSQYQIVNNQNTIPYLQQNYSLLLPVLDSTVNNIKVKIKQEEKEVFQKTVSETVHGEFILAEYNESIILRKGKLSAHEKYFLIDGLNSTLKEGAAKLFVTVGESKPVSFDLMIIWQNKPRSLRNPETAIQMLLFIESKSKVDSLLSVDEKDYPAVLEKYWEQKNPNKKSAYNSLMLEFYKRVDYSVTTYGTVDNANGAKSDRGKIYIKFGKPDEVRREYSNSGLSMEIWSYNKLKKEFVFTDKTGLGNYSLE